MLRYIQGTLDHGLTYRRSDSAQPVLGYSDADFSNDPITSRSVGGYAFILAGGAVSWASALQPLVSLSSTESEYIALTDAAKEAMWLRTFFEEIQRPLSEPLLVLGDNQGAIAFSKDDRFHTRTKHIDICFHFIRYHVENKTITLRYCPTEDMTADIITKALPSMKAKHFASSMGLVKA